MKRLLALIISFNFFSLAQAAETKQYEETLYEEYLESIANGENTNQSKLKTAGTPQTGITDFDQTIYVDALWDLVEEESPAALNALDELDPFYYDIVQRLRIHILRVKYSNKKEVQMNFIIELENELRKPKPNLKLIYLIAAYEKEIQDSSFALVIPIAKLHKSYKNVAKYSNIKKEISNDLVSDIFFKSPDSAHFGNGEYANSVKLFMFCRQSRLYPCLMVMKDAKGEVFRHEDGTIWNHKALALSASGHPSYKRNGNTPTGVMTIDSVMPIADRPMDFGVNRRLILNFIEKTKKEELIKSALPETSHTDYWWKASVTARDIGRNFLRIHGTGKINETPEVPYFPFRRTNGCIAQRENTYGDVTYEDQRVLLDSLMKALDLDANFENEEKIKGLLYIIEVDNKKQEMTLEDLKLKGIE